MPPPLQEGHGNGSSSLEAVTGDASLEILGTDEGRRSNQC